jgi:signal transduction histidine kinase
MVATLLSLIGFTVIFLINHSTGVYLRSLTVVIVMFCAFYSGAYISIIAAAMLTLAADYFFVPPIGAVLQSRTDIEHLEINLGVAILMAILSSVLRSVFRRIVLSKREAELAKQDAEHSKELMERLLALVSHDIRNPLASIRMGAQLILKSPDETDKHARILEMILSSIERADSMIQSLLDVASLRAGKTLPLEFKNCDLNEKVQKMCEEMTITNDNRLVFIPNGSIQGVWATVGLRRALENLVGNAIKYGEPLKPITIELKTDGKTAVLSVHNHGPAISKSEQAKLFDAFQRTRDSEGGPKRGWGLGLALVRGVAEAHGGLARVESNPSFGTKIILELPIRQQVGDSSQSIK